MAYGRKVEIITSVDNEKMDDHLIIPEPFLQSTSQPLNRALTYGFHLIGVTVPAFWNRLIQSIYI